MPRPAGRTGSLYFRYPHYAFRAPPELAGPASRHPVVIVGAGPVGLTAALALARHGIRSVVLDDKDSVNDGSRAICIARHSMEILQQLGVSEAFERKALGWTHGTSYYGRRPVYRLEMPHSADERYMPMYNLQQQYIEKFLVDAAQEEDDIDLRWQSRVSAAECDAGGVRLRVQSPAGEYRLDADWVLAADGARSAMRHFLGLALRGNAYEGRYVIVDIRLESDYPTERRAFFDPPANPGETVLIHRQPDSIWRIDYQLRDDEDESEALAEHHVRTRVAAILEMVNETGPWDLEWWSLYKAYTLALDDYRAGRVFFLGDAAHLVPIFGVRGLNSGFADAMNVAWKLAWVIHGWAPEALLDSYSPERRGATLDIFSNAEKSTKFMTPPTRGYRIMRDAALALAIHEAFPRPLINPRQSVPYTYRDSPLTFRSGAESGFGAGPAAGESLRNCRIGPGDYLLDHLGKGFTGLYFSAEGKLHAEIRQWADRLDPGGEPFSLLVVSEQVPESAAFPVIPDIHGRIARAYGAVDGTFYLVRPDRHVCGRWLAWNGEEVRAALARAHGRDIHA